MMLLLTTMMLTMNQCARATARWHINQPSSVLEILAPVATQPNVTDVAVADIAQPHHHHQWRPMPPSSSLPLSSTEAIPIVCHESWFIIHHYSWTLWNLISWIVVDDSHLIYGASHTHTHTQAHSPFSFNEAIGSQFPFYFSQNASGGEEREEEGMFNAIKTNFPRPRGFNRRRLTCKLAGKTNRLFSGRIATPQIQQTLVSASETFNSLFVRDLCSKFETTSHICNMHELFTL